MDLKEYEDFYDDDTPVSKAEETAYMQQYFERLKNDSYEEEEIVNDGKSVEDVKKEEIARETKLLESFIKLISIQAAKKKVDVAIFLKEGKEMIGLSVRRAVAIIKSKAIIYGARARECAENYVSAKEGKKSIMTEYKEELDEVHALFKEESDKIFDYREKIQADLQKLNADKSALIAERNEIAHSEDYKAYVERKKNVIAEIEQALEEENKKRIDEILSEFKAIIEDNPLSEIKAKIQNQNKAIGYANGKLQKCEQQLNECQTRRNNEINNLNIAKNEEISSLVKQNVFQKLVGSFINKLNGVNKFKNNVISKIQASIVDMKEKKYKELQEQVNTRINDIDVQEVVYIEEREAIVNTGKAEIIEFKGEQTKRTLQELNAGIKDNKKILREQKGAEKQQKREAIEIKKKENKIAKQNEKIAKKEDTVRKMKERIQAAQASLDASKERYAGMPLPAGGRE